MDNDRERYTVDVLRDWKLRAEAATLSEVEGVVVGQSGELENSAELEISYKKVKVLSERHDYLLEIKLRNLGNEPLVTYHIDVELPARVIERLQENQFYVQERSSQTMSFFRAIHRNESAKVYPGDTKIVMSIPYYMDHGIYFNRGNLFVQIVRATLYRPDFRPLTVEKLFGELQCF